MHSTTLSLAAEILDSHPAGLRKTANRFQIVERDGRQRVIPNDVLALFVRTKTASGYLVPYWIRTRSELIAAAAQIPSSEITELEARIAPHASTNKKTAPQLATAALHEPVQTKGSTTYDANSGTASRRQT